MNETTLRALIDDVQSGRVTADDAVKQLRHMPYVDLGFARVDHHRELRQGMPEAVYAPGKTPEHCAQVVSELLLHGTGPVILSRADANQAAVAMRANEGGKRTGNTVTWRRPRSRDERISIVTAGTADLPVAYEAQATLDALGFEPELITDCGVAGIHRMLDDLPSMQSADAVIVIAGMEGALASVVGGLTSCPVIAVPTSVGYGSALEGVTALLAMTSSCASGITVVGIDNGFGAACAATRLMNAIQAAVRNKKEVRI